MAANNPGQAIQVSPQQKKVMDFRTFLEARKGQLAEVAPKVLNLERTMKVALAAFARTPALYDCEMPSIYSAIHQAIQLGLEPGGPLGHAYLVPFKKECQLIVGYRGLVVLARRSGEIASVSAHVVCEGEKFEFKMGTDNAVAHTPDFTIDRSDPALVRAVYAVITYRDGTVTADGMGVAEVNKVRARSRAANSPYSPWNTDWCEMAKKSIVRRALKMAPLAVEMAEALEAEDRFDAGADAGFDLSALPETTGGEPVVITQETTEKEKATLKAARPAPKTASTNEPPPPGDDDAPPPDPSPMPAEVVARSLATVVAQCEAARTANDVRRARGAMEALTLDFESRTAAEKAIADAETRLKM